ncbi:MAG: MBL fold metallo-hydrolase [Alphaproteobacteria bacterium]
MSLDVVFWGVRGSIATPGPDYVEFGGNTSCVEMICRGRKLIFDAGTGIRPMGNAMTADGVSNADIFLSHTHWDHINGFPFFGPAFNPANHFTVRAGHLKAPESIKNTMAGQMTQPFFPVPLDVMSATLEFEDFEAGTTLDMGDGILIHTFALNHPNGATAYRVEFEGAAACYVTDNEHTPGKIDQGLQDFLQGADLLIYDCMYDDASFAPKVGWGHSTWQEGVRIAQGAGVKQLAIFHHDPDCVDSIMREIEKAAKAEWAGAFVAREGLKISL